MPSSLQGSWGSHRAHEMESGNQPLAQPPRSSLWVGDELRAEGVLSSSHWVGKEKISRLVSTHDPFKNSILSWCSIMYIICLFSYTCLYFIHKYTSMGAVRSLNFGDHLT